MNNDNSSFDTNTNPLPQQGDEFAQDELDALSTLTPESQGNDVYLGWNSDAPADFDGIGTIDDTYVYGLGMNKPLANEEGPNPPKKILMPLLAVAAVLFIGAIAGVVAWRLGSRSSDQTTVVQKEKEAEPKVEDTSKDEAPATVYTANNIKDIVSRSLFYDGGDVSLELSQVSVGIRGGKVMVVHQLANGTNIAPTTAVRLAGIRANVLASILTGSKVKGENNEDTNFSELVWVLRNELGAVYIATTELPGAQRASDEHYGILLGSHGYVISPSLHAGLGADAGVPISKGDTPTDLEGKPIEAKAELPSEDAPAEKQDQQPEPAAFESAEDYADNQAAEPANNSRRSTPSNNSSNNEGNNDRGESQPEQPSDSGDSGDTGDTGEDDSDAGDNPDAEPPSSDEEDA